eukprot:188166-Pelagomonas_calceolata.AAC.1
MERRPVHFSRQELHEHNRLTMDAQDYPQPQTVLELTPTCAVPACHIEEQKRNIAQSKSGRVHEGSPVLMSRQAGPPHTDQVSPKRKQFVGPAASSDAGTEVVFQECCRIMLMPQRLVPQSGMGRHNCTCDAPEPTGAVSVVAVTEIDLCTIYRCALAGGALRRTGTCRSCTTPQRLPLQASPHASAIGCMVSSSGDMEELKVLLI